MFCPNCEACKTRRVLGAAMRRAYGPTPPPYTPRIPGRDVEHATWLDSVVDGVWCVVDVVWLYCRRSVRCRDCGDLIRGDEVHGTSIADDP